MRKLMDSTIKKPSSLHSSLRKYHCYYILTYFQIIFEKLLSNLTDFGKRGCWNHIERIHSQISIRVFVLVAVTQLMLTLIWENLPRSSSVLDYSVRIYLPQVERGELCRCSRCNRSASVVMEGCTTTITENLFS